MSETESKSPTAGAWDIEPYDYGPLRTFEVTWAAGHIETFQGHSVTVPRRATVFGSAEPFWMIHGSFDGKWRNVLTAREPLIDMIRDITDGETLGGALLPGA